MKKFFIFIFCYFSIISINSSQNISCYKCDSIFTNTNVFFYPKRFTKRRIAFLVDYVSGNKIEKCIASECDTEWIIPFVPDTINILTYKEFDQMMTYNFCLIGKTKKEILDIVDFDDLYFEFHCLFLEFNVGECRSGDNPKHLNEEDCAYTIEEIRLIPFYNFSDDTENGIFLGNHNDSIKLELCKNNLEIPVYKEAHY